ncbi:MAG: hypothetical protein AABY22_17465, partial [Nanoarchaeota archaeon]
QIDQYGRDHYICVERLDLTVDATEDRNSKREVVIRNVIKIIPVEFVKGEFIRYKPVHVLYRQHNSDLIIEPDDYFD